MKCSLGISSFLEVSSSPSNKCLSSQSYGFSSSHVWMWELDHKESWALKNLCFWTVVLEKILESFLDCKKIQPAHPKGNQSWISIGRTDAEAETPILWPLDSKNWLIGKDPNAGKDIRQEEKGMTEDEIVGWHHWLNRQESEQAPGVGEGQGSLAHHSPWGHKESDTAELNRTEEPYHRACRLQDWVALGQMTNRKGAQSTHQQATGLKINWAYPCPPEQDPVFPTASPSHKEACTSLLTSSIKGQTIIPKPPEWKPQSQKANPNHHMDHSLV